MELAFNRIFFIITFLVVLPASGILKINSALNARENPVFGVASLAPHHYNPSGIAVDLFGNTYLADQWNNRILKINSEGIITTLAGTGEPGYVNGAGKTAMFNYPCGVTVDKLGNVFVADSQNDCIRKINTKGVVTTFAGAEIDAYIIDDFIDGKGLEARFNEPTGIALDTAGNVYVADKGNNAIRKISANGMVTTLAGSYQFGISDSSSTVFSFAYPTGIAVSNVGDVYVADKYNHRICKISTLGDITVLAGAIDSLREGGYKDGICTNSQFRFPSSVTVDSSGNVYVADWGNDQIRIITNKGEVTTLTGLTEVDYGKRVALEERFSYPCGLTIDRLGNLYVLDNEIRIRKINSTGIVTHIAPPGIYGYRDGKSKVARFRAPRGLAVDTFGNVFVADVKNHCIRKINKIGEVTTIAGSGKEGYADGIGTDASFNEPTDVTIDQFGNLYVADSKNNRIRKINMNGVVTTISGKRKEGNTGGNKNNAIFDDPRSVAVDLKGNIYVTEFSNNCICKISPNGRITTLSVSEGTKNNRDKSGTEFRRPTGIAVDKKGNLYVADSYNHRIQKIQNDKIVSTLAGSGRSGFIRPRIGAVYELKNNNNYIDGFGTSAKFNKPSDVAIDYAGFVYVTDLDNYVVRKISPAGVVTTLAGSTNGFSDGNGAESNFYQPIGIAVDKDGNVYISDRFRIRKISPSGVVTTLAG
jgi:sugar lactone lactonase YvrE